MPNLPNSRLISTDKRELANKLAKPALTKLKLRRQSLKTGVIRRPNATTRK